MMDRLLENDTALKILAVIAAIFIWLQAGAATAQVINRNIGPVPVGFPTPNPHLTVLSIQPSSVMVQIKGPPQSVSGAASNEVYAWVNLANLTKSGTYSLKVAASVPPGTSLVSVTPNRVIVTVARLGQARVPVAIHTSGSLASGYQLSGYTVPVKQVTISGPITLLKQVHEVIGTLALDGNNRSFSSQVVLQPVNRIGRTVTRVEVNPPVITVNANVVPIPPQKVLPVIGQLSGHPAPGYQVTQIAVYPSSETVTGSASSLSGLTHLNTQPVSIAGARSTVTETVPVVLPSGVALVTEGKVTVTVTITKSS